MAVIVPIDQSYPKFSFTCELDGVEYSFLFKWNGRASIWFFDLGDADGNPIACGLAALVGASLVAALHHLPGVPTGELVVIDSAATDIDSATDPTYDSIGRQHLLQYLSAADLA